MNRSRLHRHLGATTICLVMGWLVFVGPTEAQEPLLPNLIDVIISDTSRTFFGRHIMPGGDQNGDGYNDFLVGNHHYGAFMYHGGNPPSLSYSLRIDSVNSTSDVLGDINGDGYMDFALLGRSPYGWKLGVYYGGPDMDNIRDLWFGFDTLQAGLPAIISSDVNRSGSNELISQSLYFGSILVFELGEDSDSIPELRISPPNQLKGIDFVEFGRGLITGDFDGDGISDLAVSYRPKLLDSLYGQVWFYWGGPEFDTIPDFIITRPTDTLYDFSFAWFGSNLEQLGDLNDDGYDDFLANSGDGDDDPLSFVYFGGPDIDAVPDLILPHHITRACGTVDLNGDHYRDLLTSHSSPLSGAGWIRIFYGGPNVDSIADVTIYNRDLESWQNHFGYDIAGLGDINGDGRNDWAFSLMDRRERGNVYLMSGTGVPTDVDDPYDQMLPTEFELEQNYPNPFNPSTTIEFELPVGQHVTLEVFNVLGQRVETLADRFFPAGLHSITWNAVTPNGESHPSGIYLYRLKTAETSIANKMLLMK